MSSLPAWFEVDKCFIDGRWVGPSTRRYLPTEDPSRGLEIGRIARGDSADVTAAVVAAERALAGPWGRLTAAERGRLMLKLSQLIIARADDVARIEALDVGKPLKQAKADAPAMARYMEFYGAAADKIMCVTIPYLNGAPGLV
jgi:aldehyde dehydrogenase (NAD+)